MPASDSEANRFSARAARYARVGANMGGVAARMAGARFLGLKGEDLSNAAALAQALGGLKGPIMKVAQLLATVPDLLPPEYAQELQKLQSEAPPMGAAFVKRRMAAELGPDWQGRFGQFDLKPSAAASLGQVHRATTSDGRPLACKLQYPDMQSAVEADLKQLELAFALHRRMRVAIDTREIAKEIGDRVREELDYLREAKHAVLYGEVLRGIPAVRVPAVHPDLSTKRLLTLSWLDGEKILTHAQASLEIRNRLAHAMFKAWWHPFSRAAVIHGDPHLGNYTVFSEGGEPQGINLLDYGCIRIFHPRFVGGVVDLYKGLLHDDQARIVHAYESWGFRRLNRELIDILNIWARFIYGPLLEDRVRTVADGVKPGEYGRRQAFEVHRALKERGPVTVPREFVFMDRAAVGLGAVFLHLRSELNYHRLFEAEIDRFSLDELAARQEQALTAAGLPLPA
ncbi:ABC1 kinase family protein [Methylobacterium isbiliense]|jgi:predicted unusual protein kinase regulating ubiquinone biosynthesis (AarF/ABC1/UbiB family)|uniref:Protein kinase UbiB n=1 Tax=Methylobacterium isbiliense TaxID=315478 RepID=A0ABQ4S511_9HYPH|nr:AarF/ABC1/UbiB kinase family protein [Methylobacterium isbiliense]MDN3624794.1 AarF/ABC1/UbiB kinase family protein [Methylobacterium isbiliense]GJD98171.1 protein kinase UbiB [Methylobacterium isbiliense]